MKPIRVKPLFAVLLLPALLVACGSQLPRPVVERSAGQSDAVLPAPTLRTILPEPANVPSVTSKRGGYYKDDGPGDNPPADIDSLPDAVPRDEPLHRFANKEYEVFGKTYMPVTQKGPYKESGVASWYGRKFHGQKTSSGELYDMYGMTAAHPTLPIPSYVRVTNKRNNKSVVVRVNDRGPFHSNRVIDLSWAAAYKLGYLEQGSTQVSLESVLPGQASAAGMAGDSLSQADSMTDTERGNAITAPQSHYIQLGAFGQRSNADALRVYMTKELNELSDKLVITVAAGVYRVQLGPWPDVQMAREAALKIRTKLGIDVVTLQK